MAELWRRGLVREWSRAWWAMTREERDEWTRARASDPGKLSRLDESSRH